jgi:anti-sigma regulatory factor (Ser/Thr protein kinase)
MIWTFASEDAQKATKARRQFIEALKIRGAADSDYYAAELIFGELVGNVVRHAPGKINIRLDWTGCDAVLCVGDTGEGFDTNAKLPDAFSESGRGLFIVSKLAREFHIEKIKGDGTQACAVLPVSAKTRGNIAAC